MDPVQALTEPQANDAEEATFRFTGALVADMRAMRLRRRRTILELLAVAAGAALLGLLCALFLMK